MYGGVDGILSAFNFLVIMQSAHFPKAYILVILILKLLSDAVSLSLSNFSGKLTQNEIRETLEEQHPIDKFGLNNPYVSGMVTLTGFLVFGSIPIILYHFVLHDKSNVVVSAALILSTLFILGILKSIFIHQSLDHVLSSGAQLTFIGFIGIIASMIIGNIIHSIAGHQYVD
jgi:VIT1/CCC1 family predicted Fe2+/Mn2+ transporter